MIHKLGNTQLASAATAAAPASGATVATINAGLGDGTYQITVETQESGTVDANAANANLKHGSTVVGALPTTGSARRTIVQRELKNADTISVVVGASAGGAGAVYGASITLDRLS
jgi:hypothetical protein